MKRFEIILEKNLFDAIKIMAASNRLSINKMMIRLLEIGYIESLKREEVKK